MNGEETYVTLPGLFMALVAHEVELADLASTTGFSFPYLTLARTGTVPIRRDRALVIAKALGVELRELTGGDQ